jgi:hypothetical protein
MSKYPAKRTLGGKGCHNNPRLELLSVVSNIQCRFLTVSGDTTVGEKGGGVVWMYRVCSKKELWESLDPA